MLAAAENAAKNAKWAPPLRLTPGEAFRRRTISSPNRIIAVPPTTTHHLPYIRPSSCVARLRRGLGTLPGAAWKSWVSTFFSTPLAAQHCLTIWLVFFGRTEFRTIEGQPAGP